MKTRESQPMAREFVIAGQRHARALVPAAPGRFSLG
jgi:hypothetical protein